MKQSSNNYNLEERTQKFGEDIIEFAKEIYKNSITSPIVNQLVRAGTSVGANYTEANGADSKKDFIHKIGISKREARETKHWLRMLARCLPERKEEIKLLWKECQELTLIFQKIISSLQNKDLNNKIEN